jgi:hypothetical protein
MTATKIIGLTSVIFLVGFFIFAFRQGLRVKPERREDRGPSVGYGGGDFGGDSGHLP